MFGASTSSGASTFSILYYVSFLFLSPRGQQGSGLDTNLGVALERRNVPWTCSRQFYSSGFWFFDNLKDEEERDENQKQNQ
jgi:hypothetical protein